jgi:hypothetical protein
MGWEITRFGDSKAILDDNGRRSDCARHIDKRVDEYWRFLIG